MWKRSCFIISGNQNSSKSIPNSRVKRENLHMVQWSAKKFEDPVLNQTCVVLILPGWNRVHLDIF